MRPKDKRESKRGNGNSKRLSKQLADSRLQASEWECEEKQRLTRSFRTGLFTLLFYLIAMTQFNVSNEMDAPRGLAPHFIAPFSGQLSSSAVADSLATLPSALNELRARWLSINSVRASGLMPTFEGGPLDDAVRDGSLNPELQVDMPTAGGLPGSR